MSGTFSTVPGVAAADSIVLAALAQEEAIDPTSFPQNSVAVLPLAVVSPDSTLEPLGFGLAELLMTDLARSDQIQVVERLRIQALVRELELARSGIGDPDRGPRAGRLLGVQHLVNGTVQADRASEVAIGLNLTRTLDASSRPAVAGVASLDQILEAEKELALGVIEALGVTLSPAERGAILRHPTRNIGSLLAFSRGVQAEAEFRLMDAVHEYREAVRLDPGFETPRDRLRFLDPHIPDLAGVANLAVDYLNRPELPVVSDIVDPAFPDRRWAILIIPITIR